MQDPEGVMELISWASTHVRSATGIGAMYEQARARMRRDMERRMVEAGVPEHQAHSGGLILDRQCHKLAAIYADLAEELGVMMRAIDEQESIRERAARKQAAGFRLN
jgi:hypothetical protein